MHAVEVGEVSLAEDDSLERLVKLDGDLHQALLALHVKAGDLGHVLLGLRPHLIAALLRLDIGGLGVAGYGHIIGSVGLLGRLGLVGLLRWLGLGLILRLGLVLWPLGRSGSWHILGSLRSGSRLVLRLWWRRSVLGLWLGLGLGWRRSWLVLLLRWLRLGLGWWRLVGGLLGWRRPVDWLWWRWLVLRLLWWWRLVLRLLWWRTIVRPGGQDECLRLDRDRKWHWDGTLRPLLDRRLVLCGHGVSGGSIAVKGGGGGGTILLTGHRSGGWWSLRTVVAVNSWGVAMVIVVMVVTTSTVSLLSKHFSQLALFGNLVFIVFS
jgi:hypothetical protein